MINLKSKYIAIDTETTGLNPWSSFHRFGYYPARPFAFSFYDSKGNKEYHRWNVDPLTRQVIEGKGRKRIQKILSSKAEKVFFNAAFDIRMLELSRFKVEGKIHDALFLMHILTGGTEMNYKLKSLSEKYIGINDKDELDLLESVRKSRRLARKKKWNIADDLEADYWLADKKLCKRYAIKDAKRTMLLFLLGKPQLEDDPDLVRVYRREMHLWYVVKRMEDKGVRMFPGRVKRLKNFYKDYQVKQIKIADRNGGKGLNLNSPTQLKKVFYEQRKYEVIKVTDTGAPSLDGDTLSRFANGGDKLAKAVLENRAAKHAMSTFMEPYTHFKVKESDKTWILHPNFRQVGTKTGRFACSAPNLLAVGSSESPKRKAEIHFKPREVFGPRKDCVWYLPDFSQMEVWVFAALSQDKMMLDTLLSGKDFHGTFAKKIWGKRSDFKKKYSLHRSRAKFMTWCKFYGGGAKAVADQLGVSLELARELIIEYDTEIPGINLYIKRITNLSRKQRWVKNIYGRMYAIDSDSGYKAVNYLVQGGSADILKVAMIRVQKLLDAKYPGSQILLTLHDELIIEMLKKYHCKRTMRSVIVTMQKGHSKFLGIPVPLPIDMSIAKTRWSEYKDLGRKHLSKDCKKSICVKI